MRDYQAEPFASLVGKKFDVLDQGSIRLLDVMGSDADIAAAARTSYGKGTRKASEDRDLIRYLMRHRHTSPFEMAEIKLHVRVPMDCWRQWIRHRMASVNEYSTRYSEAIDAMQATPPDGWRLQAKDNKQGSGDLLEAESDGSYWGGADLTDFEAGFHAAARQVYRTRINSGIAREQARKDLPLSTYTEAVWKIDLHNLLHFLALRMAPDAQREIREYATILGREIVAPLFPIAWEAFRDYRLDAMTLSALDVKAVIEIASGTSPARALDFHFANARERRECHDKLARLGLVPGEVTG